MALKIPVGISSIHANNISKITVIFQKLYILLQIDYIFANTIITNIKTIRLV